MSNYSKYVTINYFVPVHICDLSSSGNHLPKQPYKNNISNPCSGTFSDIMLSFDHIIELVHPNIHWSENFVEVCNLKCWYFFLSINGSVRFLNIVTIIPTKNWFLSFCSMFLVVFVQIFHFNANDFVYTSRPEWTGLPSLADSKMVKRHREKLI